MRSVISSGLRIDVNFGDLRRDRSVVRLLRAFVVAAHVNRRAFELHHVGKTDLALGFFVQHETSVGIQLFGIDFERLRREHEQLFARLDTRFKGRVAVNPRGAAAADSAIARHDGAIDLLKLDLVRRNLEFLADHLDDHGEHAGALIDHRR